MFGSGDTGWRREQDAGGKEVRSARKDEWRASKTKFTDFTNLAVDLS